MLHVLHIVPRLDYGGVAKFLLHYYHHIDHNEFRFHFLAQGESFPYHMELKSGGSFIFYIQPYHKVGLFAYLKQIGVCIRNNKFDIIHIHTGHNTGVIAAYCRLLGCKVVICHAHTTRCMSQKQIHYMPIFRVLSRICANGLFSCGKEAGLFCFGTHNFKIIPNGVDLNVFKCSSKEEVAELKRIHGIPEDTIVIGCVAAFTYPKNHEFLVDVFSSYKKNNNNSVLLLVGDGERMQLIKEKVRSLNIADSVVFAGIQDNIPLYISIMDYFLLTSHHEGLPVVAAEAQAIGVKCIFSDRIDNSCDMGLGIMSFLPITQDAIPQWVHEISLSYQRPSYDDIYRKFCDNGYEISSAAKNLEREYKSIISKR